MGNSHDLEIGGFTATVGHMVYSQCPLTWILGEERKG